MKTEELLDAFKEMTLLELSDFVKQFEETFGVTASAPAVAVAPQGPQEITPAEPEKDEFTVVLEGAGDRKIQVIKEVRAIAGLGLKEAKDLVDSLPQEVLKSVPKDAAESTRRKLEDQGAKVSLR